MKIFSTIGVCVVGGIIGLLSQIPLSWVASSAIKQMNVPVSPVVSGTLWDGQISNLPVLGQMNVQIRPLKFITAGSPAKFDGRGPGMSISGEGGLSYIKDLKLETNLNVIPFNDGRLRGLSGNIRIDVDEAEFVPDACRLLKGRVNTNVLAANKSRLNWVGPLLSGPMRCENGSLVATVSGKDNMTDVSALVTIAPDGTYDANLTVNSRDPNAALVLPLYGFQQKGDGFNLIERGRWR